MERIVHVDRDAGGRWHVAPSAEEGERLCTTFAEASRIASDWADEHRPCELIVRDAYHRVVRRELINGESR